MSLLKSTAICLSMLISSAGVAADLPAESTPNVETLPAKYSKDWVFAQDINFNGAQDGKVVVFDVTAPSRNYKGLMGNSLFGSFAQSTTRNELYSAQTFYTRGTYGDRLDIIAIYDTETLTPGAEIVLPGGKRAQVMASRNALTLSGNDRFMYVFNFTPAASVQIIDMSTRTLLEEIQTPGCTQMYTAGETSFGMQCSNGGMSVFQIDENGKFTGRVDSVVFNDIDNDPMFIKYAELDGISYFPTFKGNIQPVSLSNDKIDVMESWSLLTDEEQAKNWRPGGWQIIDGTDVDGLMYVLMHEGGGEGTHKNGGSEVWVFDPKTKTKVRTIALKTWGVSIAITGGKTPYLAISNANFNMDVYEARTGKHLRMIGGGATQHTFQIHPVK